MNTKVKILIQWVVIFFILIPVLSISKELTGIRLMDRIKSNPDDILIYPVQHASFVIGFGDKAIYVDPVGETTLYSSYPKPNLILITDIHGDHLNIDTINAIKAENTLIVGPLEVRKQLPGIDEMHNGESSIKAGVKVEAIAMYNTTKERLKYHPKGRGNGYVITINDKRIYISGDTEDIPEMRAQHNIDIAFVCMNLPYTMDEENAASAVLEFKPKIVYPYHYRGKKDGRRILHDMKKFSNIVGKKKQIEVRFLKWY